MSLPFTTNIVTIEESDDSGDKWEQPSYSTQARDVPCVLGRSTTVATQTASGQQEATDVILYVNRDVTVTSGARVTDTVTGDQYLVQWVQDRVGFGLDRREAGLRLVTGVAA